MARTKAKRLASASLFRIAPDLALEHFGDKSLVLLAAQDRWVTVNRHAAGLLQLMRKSFRRRPFSQKDLSNLIEGHYDLGQAKARREAGEILREWRGWDILVAGDRQQCFLPIGRLARPIGKKL